MRTTGSLLRTVVGGAAALALLSACSGGSSSTASRSSTTAPTTSSSAASSAVASGSEFCTRAQSFITQASAAIGRTSGSDVAAQLRGLVTQMQSTTAPPAIASDWQTATSSLQQVGQAYQGVDLTNPQQAQQLQQKIAPLIPQLTASGQRIQQYLQAQCGISTGGSTGSATPTS
jgi:hypothetical protein